MLSPFKIPITSAFKSRIITSLIANKGGILDVSTFLEECKKLFTVRVLEYLNPTAKINFTLAAEYIMAHRQDIDPCMKYFSTRNFEICKDSDIASDFDEVKQDILNKLSGGKQISTNDLELQGRPCQSQPSTSSTTIRQPAVLVKNAYKHYGIKNPSVVLDGLDMSVPKGTIYGLLGASGCGKTTILGCILGQKKLNSGEIWVFGRSSNKKTDDVFRARMGYMPQETALYGDFTIKETLIYFGWIAGMNTKQIQEKSEIFIKLFALPDTGQRVKFLSGGEQRRVSLAATLLHEPELLILDEPTIGADILLREIIWIHLKHLSSTQNTTIIITTHYIEEARQAHTVALMRGGKLLAEAVPEKLIEQHEAQTLEDVFLKLSVLQNSNSLNSNSGQNLVVLSTNNAQYLSEILPDYSLDKQTNTSLTSLEKKTGSYSRILKRNHMKPLIWKNVLWWTRNIPALIYLATFPVSVLICFCISVGRDPIDLPVAVVNYETNNSLNCDSVLTCSGMHLSCNYLERLKNHSFILVYYDSEENAKDTVFHGETFAALIIKHNYSEALRARSNDWRSSKSWDIESANIDVFTEASDQIIGNYIKTCFFETFQIFIEDYFITCDMNPETLKSPIKSEMPVYGERSSTYTTFGLSGLLIVVVFVSGAFLTSGTMLVERNEASLERTFVMGITEIELLFGHVASETALSIIQSILGVITAYVIFDTAYKGSIVLILFLTALVGFCGLCFGIMVSSISNNHMMVILAILAIVLPSIFTSGMLWPVEGMHYLLRITFSHFPFTKPIEALRSILYKNWGLSARVVYISFISTSVWTVLFLTAGILFFKFKKRYLL